MKDSMIADELDCKMSATPLADLDKAEWSGDTLYIIIGQHPSYKLIYRDGMGQINGIKLQYK